LKVANDIQDLNPEQPHTVSVVPQKKAAMRSIPKFKSAELVEDSDEDLDTSASRGITPNPVPASDISADLGEPDVLTSSTDVNHIEIITPVAEAPNGLLSLDVAFLITKSNHIADEVVRPEYVGDKLPEIAISRDLELLTPSEIDLVSRPDGMLNDSVINSYLALLTLHFEAESAVYLRTQFWSCYAQHGYDRVKMWLPKSWTPDHTPGILLIPIHENLHWFLTSVDFAHREISLYDSLTDRSHIANKAFQVI
jgi:hypothetical protein